jgi:excisionase family DNA binding protein
MTYHHKQKQQTTDGVLLLLTVHQAAERLQLGTNRVYALVAAKTIPSVKLGKTIRIPAEALERWVEEQAGA